MLSGESIANPARSQTPSTKCITNNNTVPSNGPHTRTRRKNRKRRKSRRKRRERGRGVGRAGGSERKEEELEE